ncbi:MAG: hypothetical protein ACYSW3_23895 [Planctomycetota bacterium]|jgi:hypothetical protein
MLREKRKWWPHERESTDARHGDGATRSSEEGSVMGLEQRGGIAQLYRKDNSEVSEEDSFEESKAI